MAVEAVADSGTVRTQQVACLFVLAVMPQRTVSLHQFAIEKQLRIKKNKAARVDKYMVLRLEMSFSVSYA